MGEPEDYRSEIGRTDPERDISLPSVDEIARALRPIVRRGLPVVPEYADETLLALPGVIIRSDNPQDRLSCVSALDGLLREQLIRYPDDVLAEVASVLFGASAGSRRQPIGKRRRSAATFLGVDPEHVRTGVQPKVLKTLAWELYRDSQETVWKGEARAVLSQSLASSTGREGSPTQHADRALEQLYRYAQELTLRVETADFCARCALEIPAGNRYRNSARFVAPQPSLNGDMALWVHTYSRRYFGEVLEDRPSRDFLRENLPHEWWVWTRLDSPFKGPELGVLIEALSAAPMDEPGDFAAVLIGANHGDLRWRWSEFLAAIEWPTSTVGATMPWERPTARHRAAAIESARVVCAALQSRFASLTMDAGYAAREFRWLVETTVDSGLGISGVSLKDSDGRSLRAIPEMAMETRPPRYLLDSVGRVDWSTPTEAWFS